MIMYKRDDFSSCCNIAHTFKRGSRKEKGLKVSTGVRACFTLQCTANKHTGIGVCVHARLIHSWF